MVSFLVLLVMLALTWAFVIVPQQRRVKAHEAYVAGLLVGDRVITTAGVYGTITELSDDRVRLEIAPDVVITIARAAIGRPQDAATSEPDTVPADRTEDSE